MVQNDKYKPLPSFLSIGPSDIEGAGIIAQDDIPKDVIIGITHIYDPNFQHDHIRTPLGGFINHSDNPNCELFDEDDYKKLRTIKKIEMGKELTITYDFENFYKP